MFNVTKHLRRRVSIRDLHGRSSVRIERQNSRGLYFWMMCLTSVGFVLFCDMLFDTSRRHPDDVLYISPLLVLGLACYVIGLAIAVWGAFGVEGIVVEGGSLRWTRTALKWRRTREIPINDVTEIRAITPWHGLDNTVEVTAQRRRHRIGDRLLQDEATELANHLRRVIGLSR
jgi:hypothetical protein